MERTRDQRSGATVERVLLVDDNPTNLQILHRTLERSGYDLLSAGDGRTALELARRHRPSLVLLDIMMPDMDGYAVCRQLKSDPDRAEQLGVERFMKHYFLVAKDVGNLTRIFCAQLEAENQQILNAVSEGIIGLDQDGRVTMLNPAASSITTPSTRLVSGPTIVMRNSAFGDGGLR